MLHICGLPRVDCREDQMYQLKQAGRVCVADGTF